MPTFEYVTPHRRGGIASRFYVVLAVLIPAMVAVAALGIHGLARMNDELDTISEDEVPQMQLAAELEEGLQAAQVTALRLIPTTNVALQERLGSELDTDIRSRVERAIAALRESNASDPNDRGDLAKVDRISRQWKEFLGLRRQGVFEVVGEDAVSARLNDRLADRLSRIFTPMTGLARKLSDQEVAEVKQSRDRAEGTYAATRLLVLLALGTAGLIAVGTVLWLIHTIVPRIKAYSRFSVQVAQGELGGRLEPTGDDEITVLGRTLNTMVDRRAAERAHESRQAEFAQMMQITEAEEEAHELLKRHLERSVAGSSVVVLNRNNSADRLEATTAVAPGSQLETTLAQAKPRSCLAVRFGRAHTEGGEGEPLVQCEICGGAPGRSDCEPLLVGGEVIGSVLVHHDEPLADQERNAITSSITQAAPVLANLRNLALAEFRASTDALTGLPNSRAVQDTVKRMVAQASRTATPLAAALLDLDHFKQINDYYGHARGDEVLAAAGIVLRASVRESDFVGRYGGEEFVILMPGTSREGAVAVLEKIRATFATITVPTVNRAITASAGIAVLPEDGGDVATLLRNADRALYAAKSNGRNRVEVCSPSTSAFRSQVSAAEEPSRTEGGFETVHAVPNRSG